MISDSRWTSRFSPCGPRLRRGPFSLRTALETSRKLVPGCAPLDVADNGRF